MTKKVSLSSIDRDKTSDKADAATVSEIRYRRYCVRDRILVDDLEGDK